MGHFVFGAVCLEKGRNLLGNGSSLGGAPRWNAKVLPMAVATCLTRKMARTSLILAELFRREGKRSSEML